MKTLQNNFTTQEQSKRLLELGVPADSADCHYLSELDPYVYVLTMPFSVLIGFVGNSKCIPCWSVGRLMEITYICDKKKIDIRIMDLCTNPNNTIMQQLIDILEYAIKLNDIDFSKLEE